MPEDPSKKRKAQQRNHGDIRTLLSSSPSIKNGEPECKVARTDGPPSDRISEDKMLHNFPSSQNSRQVIDLTSNSPTKPRFVPLNRAGPKKLVVKNFRPTPSSVPERYFAEVREKLERALDGIFGSERNNESLEELYRGVENLCRANQAAEVFARLQSKCERYMHDVLRPKLQGRHYENTSIVHEIEGVWGQWCQQLAVVRNVYFYLDRSYLLNSPTLPSIWDMGTGLFRTHMLEDQILGDRFFTGLFLMFEQDRRGKNTSKSTLLSALRMISALGIYTNTFEPRFVETSRRYYADVAEDLAQNADISKYVAEAARQIEAEEERCNLFSLEACTREKAVRVAEDELAAKRASQLIESGFVRLIEQGDEKSLTMLYGLLQRVGSARMLVPVWSRYIREAGTALVMDPSKDSTMVDTLIEFKDKLDGLVRRCFHNDDELGNALRESFSAFINTRKNTPAEMIAKYLDGILRSGNKTMDETDLELRMDKLLSLFRFIQGKDTFEAFYKKDLAKRLLLNRSASADAERSMLTRLKTECGSMFTQKLEGMFNDVDISKDFMASWKQTKHAKDEGIDLYANVLSQAFWPAYPETHVVLPQQMSALLETFRMFYLTKQSGRKLVWRHALGHCVVRASFPSGRKELTLSLFQAVVLLLFNDTAEDRPLGYAEIKAATGLEDRELTRTLQSLACGRVRVLSKHPRGKDVAPTDGFTVNSAFSHEAYRIKINQIQVKETKEEKQETHEQVHKDRQFEIQAAIIRILKSKKKMRHVELVQQTIEHTKNRGTLDLADIKTQIERLIDKEYMERTDKDTYVYLA